jgi:hypothetical protein
MAGTVKPVRTRYLLVASLIGGAITTFLSKVPIVNLVDCLVCADLWLGPLFSVWLYRRLAGTVSIRKAVAVGTLAGLWAAIPTFAVALGSLSAAPALRQGYPAYLPIEAGFAITSHVLGMFSLVAFDVLFGAAGGLIGGAIFRSKPTPLPVPPGS